jgi:hypothetical protein
MNSSMVRRARTVRLFGLMVMLAGFVPVLFLMAQSAVPGVLPEIHDWPAMDNLTWIPHHLHAWVAIALVGLAVMTFGAGIARRQSVVLHAAARHREDSLRRAPQYSVDERIEPYIGPDLPGTAPVMRHQEIG